VVFLGIAQIYLSNRLATWGRQLNQLEQETAQLEENNKEFKSEIASLGCLTKLTDAAQKKGFVANPPVLNLSSKIPVALKTP
jgi:cell division protein FtsL